MTKYESLWEDFQEAVKRLEEILKEPRSDIVRDSAIKRFELVFDLSWKTLKALLEEQHAISCASPRNCFQEAFRVGIIDYNEGWLGLISDRNYTAHMYKETLAEKIYIALPQKLILFQNLEKRLEKSKDD